MVLRVRVPSLLPMSKLTTGVWHDNTRCGWKSFCWVRLQGCFYWRRQSPRKLNRKITVMSTDTKIKPKANRKYHNSPSPRLPRLLAWIQEHNSHGEYYDNPCWLPEGDSPEIGNYVRAPWLDQPQSMWNTFTTIILIDKLKCGSIQNILGKDPSKTMTLQRVLCLKGIHM